MILTRFLAILLAVLFAFAARAEEWRKADADLSKQVVNCLIDTWLQSMDYRRATERYDIVITVKSIDDHRVPAAREEAQFRKKTYEPSFCVKHKQRDFHAMLVKEGKLTLTNGRPVAKDGEVRGFAYGIMDVYRRGDELAIYVQSGSYWRKQVKGVDCEYDATSSGYRAYLRNRARTIAYVGEVDLWVADGIPPLCWNE